MSTDAVVGVDLGTSGLKAVALGADGQIMGRASARYRTARPEAGASEQRPEDWLAALRQALADLSGLVPARQWRGLGLSGMIPTLVALDAGDRPVGPAITWEDSRAEEHAAAIRAAAWADEIYRVTGQWLDGRYLLPMRARLGSVRSPDASQITRIASAKDYLLWWLTGQWYTDPSTAAGYGCYDLRLGAWDERILAAAGCADQRLPEIADPGRAVPVAAGHGSECGLPAGLPVVVGAADSVLAVLGLGVREPGEVAYVAGTSTVILGISADLRLDPEHRYLVTPLAGIGGWGLEMDLLATGSAVQWLSGLFGCAEADLIALAERCDPAEAPTFLPFLAPGEQGALWDPLLTGAVLGVDLRHDRGHLARGLLTGITLESRRCLRLLERATGLAGTLRVAGGSAASPVFRQDLADASGRTAVADTGFADYSALGAAYLAAGSAGFDQPATVRQATAGQQGIAGRSVHRPDPSRAATWRDLAVRHDDVLAAVRHRTALTGPVASAPSLAI